MRKYFGLYGGVLLIIQVLGGCGPDARTPAPAAKQDTAQQTGAAAQKNTRLIIAFGDSLYAGYRLGPKEGFAPQLQSALRDNDMAVSVLNAGVSGDTTSAGKARLNFVLDNAPQKPALVILGLGGNDMLRGIKPGETRANLTAMLDELKRRNIPVIVTGMLASPNMGPDYASAFNPIFPDLAKKYDVPLYPFFLDGVVTDANLMLDDGIHPNTKGITKIVTGIEPVIATVLEK